ncbi:MAG: succinate dehydrogenase, hydrophobic membrane anchor protein [Alphaproteobacteria bacterium]
MNKIKIAPSTKSGSHHWLCQRFSAIALIPLIIWLVISFVEISQDPQNYFPVFFAYPFNAVMGILLITTSLYHGALGMRVIIEDYITCGFKVYFYIMLVNFISILTAVASVLAILRLHFIG